MKHFKRQLRYRLAATRIGRWILIYRYEVYLDHFWRMMLATDAYRDAAKQRPLRFRLHRCIHRLEKGLSMPARRKGFGREVMLELVMLLKRWKAMCGESHPSYCWGLDAAAAYFGVLDRDIESLRPDDAERSRLESLRGELRQAWSGLTLRDPGVRTVTPIKGARFPGPGALDAFISLINSRQSVRRWDGSPVPRAVIEEAMEHALRAPSACNRQPFGLVAIEDRDIIRSAVGLLSGGGGFAEDAPLLLALTSDFGAYSGHEQRNLAYIDGGLAAMTFLLSLTAQGYATVPMNWSVEVRRDRRARSLLGIGETQVILFFVAVGRAHREALIPASVRRPIDEALVWIADGARASSASRSVPSGAASL